MRIDRFSATFLCNYVMVEVVKIPKDIKDVIRNRKTMDSPLQYQYYVDVDEYQLPDWLPLPKEKM